jgi:hypothetical protein
MKIFEKLRVHTPNKGAKEEGFHCNNILSLVYFNTTPYDMVKVSTRPCVDPFKIQLS